MSAIDLSTQNYFSSLLGPDSDMMCVFRGSAPYTKKAAAQALPRGCGSVGGPEEAFS